ncbi:MAG TPA: DUF3858 domain-containing protein [Halanaerobiales bacterium]|nr:DUF3858 domain-containing protein [Halanaerobiales bacterium]
MRVDNYAEKMGNMLTIKPFKFPINLTQVVASENRNYPIYLSFKRNVKRTIKINIPEGYKVNFLPKSQSYNNEVGSFELNYQKKANEITAKLNLILDRKEISVKEYNSAKKLLNKANSSIQNQIMIQSK